MSYPEDSLQNFISDTWWIKDETRDLKTGSLLWAIVNHAGIVPHRLEIQGRTNPTEHSRADYLVQKFSVQSRPADQKLPIAALPAHAGESYALYRAKTRPVLVISTNFPQVAKADRGRQLRYQTDPAILVAPYYGVNAGKRVGFKEPFLSNIKRCEYPQYMWDCLPFAKNGEGSVLRLDHIMPIGRSQDWFKHTGYSLDENAVHIMKQWLSWVLEGELDPESELHEIRETLLNND